MNIQKIAAVGLSFLLFVFFLQKDVFANSLTGNGKITFVSNRDGNAEIYSMNANGTSPTRLTNNPSDDFAPVWSPDGQKIAFITDRDNNYEIYVMNADGSNTIRLTNNSNDDIDPSWSPDGSQIVFATDRDGGAFQLYVMNADGSNQHRLTNDAGNDESPAWSPDGSKIAYDDSSQTIYVVNADGSNATALSKTSDGQPSWSPDGSKIVFTSDRDGTFAVYVMNANGSGQTRLTINSVSNVDPTWSPDGHKIAYASNINTYYQIFVMNIDGTDQVPITTDTQGDGGPNWQAVQSSPCPKNPGFWKQNAAAWPVKSLKLGSKTYTRTQLISLMNLPPKNDESLTLADQLIAAKLNIAEGSLASPIHSRILTSDKLLAHYEGFLPYHVTRSTTDGRAMVNIVPILNKYNTRVLTPACTQ